MDFHFMASTFPKIVSVLPMTLYISIVATVIGFIFAVLIAVARERQIPVLAPVLGVLVSFVRGTPILVQLYVVYYGLPRLLVALDGRGGSLPATLIAISAYAINAAANLSETVRSAYHSIDSRQYQAALSVGMTPTRGIVRIVVPQLITNLIPNFANFFLDLLKDTSLVYNIGIIEIMGKSNILASFGFQYLEAYLDALFVYLITCWVFAKVLQLAELYAKKHVFNHVKTA